MKNLMKRLKDQRGLTLIELLAVIVILGIIAAIAVPSIGNIIENTKIDAAKSDAIQVLNAAKLYQAEGGIIPESNDTATKSVGKAELAKYLDSLTNLADTYKVAVNTSGNLIISADSPSGADVTVDINNATVKMINDADKGAKVIPAPAGS